MNAARGVKGAPSEPPAGVVITAAAAELLARLHATFWGRPPGWVYSASGDHTSLLTGPLLNTSARRLAERCAIPVEDGRFIIDNYRAVAEVIDREPNTVMHGDAHPGNVYFRNGEAGLLEAAALDAVDSEVAALIDQAVEIARAAPPPDTDTLLRDVYVSY